jgi:dTDP-4-dehydrorhamnose reductase
MATSQSQPSGPWLVTGATGLLGNQVVRQAAGRVPLWGAWFSVQPAPYHGVDYVQLDVGDRQAVLQLMQRLRPRAIIHTAYRKEGPDLRRVTAQGAGYIAQAAAAIGARLVHLSSDVLLDGEHPPYDESAPPAPLHPYGQAKAEAEAAVQQAAPDAAIVRTSLICRLQPPDPISAWVIDSLRQGRSITLFTDEIRSPVWVQDLAAALIELVELPVSGVLNVAGPQPLSRYQMGVRLARCFGLDAQGISAGSSLDSGLRRPRNCTLDVRLAQRLLRTRLRSYDEGLADAKPYDQSGRSPVQRPN